MFDHDLSQWVGNTTEVRGSLDESAAAQHAATLGLTSGRSGDVAPALSHWCAFTPDVPTKDLSPDGHPMLGGFMPPVTLQRRMWAGGALTFHAPLHIGAPITRRSEITAINQKDGASGAMVFVTVAHEVFEGPTHILSESQDIVYLDIPDSYAPPKRKPVPENPDLIKAVTMSEALLFRFSAATFNAHRIHYDLPYAQAVEKYPGLVVHGPLQAMLLMDAATKHADRTAKTFRFRGIHPMFHFDDMHIFGHRAEDGMSLCTGLVGGHQGMQAKITWGDQQ